MSKGFASTSRVAIIAVGLFGCFAALGARLVWLHVFSRDELLGSIAKAQRDLGWVPTRGLDLQIEDTVRWRRAMVR